MQRQRPKDLAVQRAPDRVKSVDIVRLAAIVAVIAIHTTPFGVDQHPAGASLWQAGWMIKQVCRFAVPFFFVMSGYFWGVKVRNGAAPAAVSAALAKRLMIILAAWSFIYLLPYNIGSVIELGWTGPFREAYWNIISVLSAPWRLLLQGTKYHLWFLAALLYALAIATYFVAKGWHQALVAVAAVLFIAALLMTAYAPTPLGMSTVLEARNGPFFGTLFFVSGIYIGKLRPAAAWLWQGTLLLLLGLVLQVAESMVLWHLYGVNPDPDFTVGTCFMGWGAAMVALSNHRWLQNERLSGIGKYTLGIYAVHLVFVEIFKPVDRYLSSALWEIGCVALVFACSLLTVSMLARQRALRQIVL